MTNRAPLADLTRELEVDERLSAMARQLAREPFGVALDGDCTGETPRRDAEVRAAARLAPKASIAVAEPYPVFAARLAGRPLPPDLVPGLIPGSGAAMVHGQPRALKTWVMLELARALVTGDTPFGIEAFRVASPRRTWYITEEDPELEIHARFECLFEGRKQYTRPDALHVSVQKTVSLDDLRWQDAVVAYAVEHAIEAICLDPIRSLSSAVDQGPDKLRPLAMFLRRLMRESKAPVLLNHHDTKPLVGKHDDRARPQRASGGGIYSIADAPIHAERLGTASRTKLTPSYYKFAIVPEPFVVTLKSDDPRRPTWVRLEGESTAAINAEATSLHGRICDYLRDHPATSGSKVAKALHISKEQGLHALERLRQDGRAAFLQQGKARLWTVLAGENQR